jgi:hypothetical protein
MPIVFCGLKADASSHVRLARLPWAKFICSLREVGIYRIGGQLEVPEFCDVATRKSYCGSFLPFTLLRDVRMTAAYVDVVAGSAGAPGLKAL